MLSLAARLQESCRWTPDVPYSLLSLELVLGQTQLLVQMLLFLRRPGLTSRIERGIPTLAWQDGDSF